MSEPRASRPSMPGYGLAAENEGQGLRPFQWARERLERSRNYFVSSVRPDGRPHSMPVWGVWLDDAWWFSTGKLSRKARNLSENAACVVTTEGANECVIVEGEARRVADASECARFFAAYAKKYEWDLAAKTDEPTFVVRPRVVFGFSEAAEQFIGGSTRWTF